MNFLYNCSPLVQTIIFSSFSWLVTAFGALIVLLFNNSNKKFLNSLLSLSSGIMLSASFWSLLKPAIELVDNFSGTCVVIFGFLCGGIFIFLFGLLCDKFSLNTTTKRSLLLIVSITLHNIPEGLVIGVAFGSLYNGYDSVSLMSAIILSLGIAIQNFPEGGAISLPLMREGYSKMKAFFFGQFSGFVEPIFAIVGVILAMLIKSLLPFLLAFAAGAMIFVIVCELIPESQSSNKNFMGIVFLFGFIIMMFLDNVFG